MIVDQTKKIKGNSEEKPFCYQADAFFRFRDWGYNLIPIDAQSDKKPLVKWKLFQTQKITNDDLSRWLRSFRQRTTVNFGVLTGLAPYSKVVEIMLVDADDEAAIELVESTMPKTPCTQRTPGAGKHFGYRRPSAAAVAYLGNRQKTTYNGKVYNLDIRGDGGYFMCPGSINYKTKKQYKEDVVWTAEMMAAMPVYDPSWLVCEKRGDKPQRPPGEHVFFDDEEFLERFSHIGVPTEERLRQANCYAAAVPGTVQGTGADTACMALTYSLLYGFALPPQDCLEVLLAWGEEDDNKDKGNGYYPWQEKELVRKIEYAMSKEYDGEVGHRLNRFNRHETPTILDDSFFEPEPGEPKEPQPGDPQPEPKAQHEPKEPQPKAQRRRRGLKLADLDSLPDPQYLVNDHLQTGGLSLLVGPSAVGKTFYALDLALSVATGLDYQDCYDVLMGPVVYLCSEGVGSFKLRCRAWLRQHQLTTYPENMIVIPHTFDLLDPPEVKELVGIMGTDLGQKPSLVIIDTLARNFGAGDENSQKDMNKFVQALDNLRERGIAVMVVHHTGKDLARKERGSTALRGAADTVILLEDTDNGKGVLVTCDKQKDAEPFEKYILKKTKVPAGKDKDGETLTSLVLLPQGTMSTRFRLLKKEKKTMLSDLYNTFGPAPFTLAQASDASGASRSSTHRYLTDFLAQGMVNKTGETYTLTGPVIAMIIVQ